MIMQIPKKIKVGGITYTCSIIDSTSREIDSKAVAEMATEKCTITIREGERQYMEQTFLHELIHAINVELGEETTEFLAQALYQVIVDNPKIFQTQGGEVKHGKRKN